MPLGGGGEAGFDCALPPPQEAQKAAARSRTAAHMLKFGREARFSLDSIPNARSQAKQSVTAPHGRSGGASRGRTRGGRIEWAVVVTVTVAVAGLAPTGVEEGETLHVDAAGAPEQIHVTV